MKQLFSKQPMAPARAARLARIALLGLGLYLLFLNATGLFLTRALLQAADLTSTEMLERLGRRLTEPPREYFWVLEYTWDAETGAVDDASVAIYSELAEWRNMTDALASTAREPRVTRVDLLTPSGEILLTQLGITPPAGERREFIESDRDAIAAAAKGETVASLLTPNDMRKRIYHPVPDREGKIVALMRLEVEDLSRLATARTRLFLGLLVSIGVLIFLWWWMTKMVRRTVEAERAAAQSDRLRALGTMTAGIAHEIRNPLGIISLQVEELRAVVSEVRDEKTREGLLAIANDLQSETKRLKELTQSFLAFTKASSARDKVFTPIDLTTATADVVRLWSKGLPPELRKVESHLPQRPCLANFSPDRLKQVLLNLLRNADEAMGGQPGTITVRVDRRQGQVLVSVEDTGPGIDPATMEQIFDPFFTTRAEGTGLGLSVSRALADAAGGSLTVESVRGKGSTFTLALPELDENRLGSSQAVGIVGVQD